MRKGTSLVVCLSDLHFGKNSPGFGIEVAAKRLAEIPAKLAKSPDHYVPEEIVLILGGDLTEGEDIFAHQNSTNTEPAIDQNDQALKSIWKLIKDLRKQYPKTKIRIEETPGNHGRVSKTAHPKTNWDNELYRDIHRMLLVEKPAKITFAPEFKRFKKVKVQGTFGLLDHYGLKHLGTPSMQRKLSAWCRRQGATWLFHGHWHHLSFQPYEDKWLISNGSLGGPDDLAEHMGLFEPARQAYFSVTGNRLHSFNWFEWED